MNAQINVLSVLEKLYSRVLIERVFQETESRIRKE